MKIRRRLTGGYRITLTEDELTDMAGLLEDHPEPQAQEWAEAMDQARSSGCATAPSVYTGSDEPDLSECPECHHQTMCSAGVHALTPDGPRRMGEWAFCAHCHHSPYATKETP